MPYLLIYLISLVFSINSWAQENTVELPIVSPGLIESENLRYLWTEQDTLSNNFPAIDEYSWQPLKTIMINPDGHHVWLRFRISLNYDPTQQLVITASDFFTDRATFYLLRGGEVLQKTDFGNAVPVKQREVPYIFPVIPLNISADGVYDILLQTQNRTPRLLLYELSVIPERDLAYVRLPGEIAKRSIVIGVISLVLLIVLVLLLVRYRSEFVYASIFLLASIGTLMLWDGTVFPLFGIENPWWYLQGVGAMLFCAIGGALLCLAERLAVQKSALILYVRGSAAAMFLFALVMAIREVYHTVIYANLVFLVYANSIALMVFLVAISLWKAIKGDWRSRISASVWTVFACMALFRFIRAVYPDFYLGTSRQWSFSLALTGLWLLIEYLWDIALEEFGKRKQQLAAESRIEMVNRLSHEIRTPLNAVIGLADLLKTNRDSAQTEKFADMIQSSGKTLLGLVNDILDFSKLGSQTTHLGKQPLRFDKMLAEAMNHFLQVMGQKQMAGLAYIDPKVPLYLLGDEVRLQQIFFNLVNNAIKFTPEGGVLKIIISSKTETDDRVCLSCEVSDNGRGIPEEMLDNVFEPFMQARPDDSSYLKGVGLGLAITKLLVESMGGNIAVESHLGLGTTFRFDLWLDKNPHAPDCKALFKPLVGKRIAMISQMEVLTKQYLDYLNLFGAKNTSYSSLSEFIDDGEDFDLVIVESYFSFKAADAHLLSGELAKYKVIIIDSRRELWPAGLESERVKMAVMPLTSMSLMAMACSLISGRKVTLPDEQEPEMQVMDFGAHRILVADDNALNLVVCGKLLESLQVDYVTIEGGSRVLETLTQDSFSLLLLDCEMPDMNGYEVAKQIRAYEKEKHLPRLPIVALTAHALDDVRIQCLQVGMDEVMHKPVSRADLAALLQRYPLPEAVS